MLWYVLLIATWLLSFSNDFCSIIASDLTIIFSPFPRMFDPAMILSCWHINSLALSTWTIITTAIVPCHNFFFCPTLQAAAVDVFISALCTTVTIASAFIRKYHLPSHRHNIHFYSSFVEWGTLHHLSIPSPPHLISNLWSGSTNWVFSTRWWWKLWKINQKTSTSRIDFAVSNSIDGVFLFSATGYHFDVLLLTWLVWT